MEFKAYPKTPLLIVGGSLNFGAEKRGGRRRRKTDMQRAKN